MPDSPVRLIYLDDYHAGDVLFVQGLSKAMARRSWRPAPVILHGSGEHAERLLESHGIFRRRTGGVLEIESAAEHELVDRALRRLNQKLVGLLTDAVVSSVGIVGAQRNIFVVEEGGLRADAASVRQAAEQGVVAVVAATAREPRTGSTGEIPLADAAVALAEALEAERGAVEVVFFTKTNLPGVMKDGAARPEAEASDPALREVLPDPAALDRVSDAGLPVLITNSNRLADKEGPSGTRLPR